MADLLIGGMLFIFLWTSRMVLWTSRMVLLRMVLLHMVRKLGSHRIGPGSLMGQIIHNAATTYESNSTNSMC